MSAGLSYAAEINPWVAHQVRPFPSRGFVRHGAAALVFGEAAPVITFQTDELAVRLARLVIFDEWIGSASMMLFVRARGAVLEEYHQQFTHDTEGGSVVYRLDALCPPSSQIELSALSLTDSGNVRQTAWWLSGWLEPWPDSRQPPDLWKGVAR